MKFAFNIRPHILIAVTVSVGVLMIFSAFWELDRSKHELSHVVHEEAVSLVEAIHQSSVNTILATDQIEAILAERLINNAWFVAYLDSAGLLTPGRLAGIAAANRIYRINILDRHGRRVMSNHSPEPGHRVLAQRHQPADIIGPILRGETATMVIGLKEARFEDGQRYAVAVRRRGIAGGAIVLNLDAAELLAFRKQIGIGKLIRDLGDNSGIVFVALQDSLGIIAASGQVTELSSFGADTMLERTMIDDTTLMRESVFGDVTIAEVIHPLVLDHTAMGVLRIGLSLDEVHAAEERMQRRMIVISVVLLLLATLVTMTIIASRNYQRVQRELQRTEKLIAMGELASGVAHEIRNPLNAIAMIAQRFSMEFVPRRGAAEYRALTGVLRTEAQRVNAIITHFLRFARPPRLHREAINPGELITHCAALVDPRMKEKEISFTVTHHGDEPVMLDRDQMTQALLNLLLNALEATPVGGKIALASWTDHNGAVITVTDTGHGIGPEAIEKVFNLYYTTKADGTGMGLPMAQQIVAQHQGRLEVESTPGKGTRCTVRVPPGNP